MFPDIKPKYPSSANLNITLLGGLPYYLKCGKRWYVSFSAEPSTFSDKITINVQLILKMRDIILSLQANYFMGHFEGAKKVRPPRNIPKWPIN
jgi:hypothetical protein